MRAPQTAALAAVLLAAALAGCSDAPAAEPDAPGAAAVPGGESPAAPVVPQAVGGAGHAEQPGCGVSVRPELIDFCGVGLAVGNGTLAVVAVNTTVPVAWKDIELGATQPANATGLRAGNWSASMALPTGGSGAPADAILPGDVRVGDRVRLCRQAGTGELGVTLTDTRPIGGFAKAAVQVPGCSAEPFAAAFDLLVFAADAPSFRFTSKVQCVRAEAGGPWSATVEASWTPQSPLQDNMHLMVGANGTLVAEATGPSPMRLQASGAAGAWEVVVRPPSPGFAVDQSIHVDIEGVARGGVATQQADC